MDETFFLDLATRLEILVTERLQVNEFRALTPVPGFWKALFPQANYGRGDLVNLEESPFLVHFVEDAEDYWQRPTEDELHSDPWTESDAQDSEIFLQASALVCQGRRILVVRRLGEYIERGREVVQYSRERLIQEQHQSSELKREIESRKETEIKLTEEKARVSAIFENVLEGIVICDEAGRVEEFNQAAGNILGYESREMTGKNVSLLIGSSHKDRHDDYLKAFRETGRCVLLELGYGIIGRGRESVGMRKDGTTFPMELSVTEVFFGNKRRFIGVVRDITERKRVEEEIRKQNRIMSQELELASQLQQALMPTSLSCENYLRIFIVFQPMVKASGDFHDLVNLPQGRTGFVQVDVKGHGVRSAMQGAMFKMAFQSLVSEGNSPSRLMSQLNDQFEKILPEDDFMTVFYGVIDPGTMRLTYSNAGHPPPLLYRARDGKIEELGTGGTIVGAFPGLVFEEAHVDLEPCDRLLVYTDGLTETCSNKSRYDFYGESRLKRLFRYSSQFEDSKVLQLIVDDVTAFHGNESFEDDLSMMLVEVQPDISPEKAFSCEGPELS
ncbi:PP2C family protein-serine/threonine phosphatase [Thermodesulfobacteriota bacterium]